MSEHPEAPELPSALDLLSGDAQTFREKIWASHMHVHRTDPARFIHTLSLNDVDDLLLSSAIRTPAVRVAKNGTVLPESSFTTGGASLAGKPMTGLVDGRKILDLFADGSTIVLQGLHRYWPPLTDLIARLELELGHPCQANAYLTPAGSQGFAVHSDAHDVFVIQTYGSKEWQVHTPDGVEDILLQPGVCMYLPTGTPHAARAQDTASLHVTVGINQLTWRDLLRRVIAQEVDRQSAAHVPAGYLEDPALLSSGLAERLSELADDLRSVDVDSAAHGQIRRFLTTRPTRLTGGLTDALSGAGITDDTLLLRRPGHPCVLRDEEDRVRVLLGDRSLSMPGWLRGTLHRIQHTTQLRPADLADLLSESSRLVLCRRLVREGLLQLDPASAREDLAPAQIEPSQTRRDHPPASGSSVDVGE